MELAVSDFVLDASSQKQAIACVMDVVTATQILMKGEFGKGVAGAIEFYHGGLELLPGASG
jgi:hypothetical protein